MAASPAPGSTSPRPSAGGKTPRPSVAVVGAGAVGTALAHRLRAAGYPIASILSRSLRSAQELATAVGAPAASDDVRALPEEATLLFLCVPDDQVRAVAGALADQPHPWQRCLAVHTSGALPAAALRSLAEQGAATLSFHPLQAFAREAGAEAFDGIYVGLQGETEAVAAGQALAEALHVKTLVLAEQDKARYHMAASMASNLLVTLLALAGEVLDDTSTASDSRGIDEGDGAEWLRPLVEGTVRNLRQAEPATALTGPVVRGDEETVAAHLKMLRTYHPGFLPVYAALTVETVRLAARTNRLSSDVTDRLLSQLDEALGARPGAKRKGRAAGAER